jgi:hypothetical protein
MLRTILLISVLGPSLLACARGPALQVGTTVHPCAATADTRPPPPEPAGVAVVYRLLRIGEGDGVVLSGRTHVDPHHGARVDAVGAHTLAQQKLQFDARPREDGSVVVDVRYEETTVEGAHIEWMPQMRVAHGATGRAEVSGGSWGRAIEVSVE